MLTDKPSKRYLAWPVVIGAAAAITACSMGEASTDDRSAKTENTPQVSVQAEPVCGLVDEAVVEEVLGTTDVSTTGTAARAQDEGVGVDSEATDCIITPRDAKHPAITVEVEQVSDEDETRTRVQDESSGPDCDWLADPDYEGYICDVATAGHGHDVGIKAVRDGTLIHVSISGWSDSNSDRRTALTQVATSSVFFSFAPEER